MTLSEEDASFKAWWKSKSIEDPGYYQAQEAWEAATLAERERLKKAISADCKVIEEDYTSLSGETGQYFAGRLDSYFEVLYAIDNP